MADIRELFDHAMERMPDASRITVKLDDAEITVERGFQPPPLPAPLPSTGSQESAHNTNRFMQTSPDNRSNETLVTAPLVGVFYAAPSPDSEPFVKKGQQVKKGETLCIIEAMKMLNEIESTCDGVVERILVENGVMVEYGQQLFSIRTE